MKKELLIVDGYNMIGAWPELVALKDKNLLEEAREQLLKKLSNYAKFEDLEIIVVFDAQFVPGITQTYNKYSLEVIFTEEGQTADSYIEKMAGEKNNRLTQVAVATSDLAEQWVVFSQGALRVSANELFKRIKKAEEQIRGKMEDVKFENFRRNSPWNEGQLDQLDTKLTQLSGAPRLNKVELKGKLPQTKENNPTHRMSKKPINNLAATKAKRGSKKNPNRKTP